jgi:hypothetical protein
MLFEEIKFVGVDNIRTHKSNPEQVSYAVYFELSKVPTIEWCQIFEENHLANQATLRRVWIDGRYIVIECLINEVVDIVEDIKKEITKTNNNYHTSLIMHTCPESLDSLTQPILNNNKTGGI